MRIWLKRIGLAAPFAIAALLTGLGMTADRLHLYREHIAGYCFLFATPWAWLLDRGWFVFGSHSLWVNTAVEYSVLLWIPAALYSGCLWLFLRACRFLSRRKRAEWVRGAHSRTT
jgi:hypothetical protein